MTQISRLISRYLIFTVAPYFIFSWLLLSVILFVQQAGRYADIFFSVNVPGNLVWQLAFALVPNVIAFTCPMAILVGTIIGLSKMQGDSELVAIRASGVGNLQIAVPIMIGGALLSVFAFFVNLWGVPMAASLVRSVAMETAIRKLESPIEPGVFNSDVTGYTIYVRDGDVSTGRWKNIFIAGEDPKEGTLRLITSGDGRIDVSGQASELVLENALVTTLPTTPGAGKYVSENIGEVRLAIRTRRTDLLEKVTRSELTAEELGLQELSDYANTLSGREQIEARILWQRRIILSITPFIFCLLGTVIVLRFTRGGHGFGVFIALVVLVGFYLLAFFAEQLARTGSISVTLSGMVPILGSVVLIAWLGLSPRINLFARVTGYIKSGFSVLRNPRRKVQARNLFVDLTTGLRDFDLTRNLVANFVLALAFLIAIFTIFTGFDLWKFAGSFEGGPLLLVKYLGLLLPFMYLQIAPSAAMIATLATYVVKSRQNEIVTWTSAGQSIYRLLLPCFLLAVLLGGFNWVIQETVAPPSNRLQQEVRNLIRARGVTADQQQTKSWVANQRRIYSFILASDNEKRDTCPAGCARAFTAYEFDDKRLNLQAVYRGDRVAWENGRIRFFGNTEKNVLTGPRISTSTLEAVELIEPSNPFAEIRRKPGDLSSSELRRQMDTVESELERAGLKVALEKKYSTLFLPLVVVLFTAPFSLSLSRKGKAAAVGYAVALWLLFTGASAVLEQTGLNGMLSPSLAVWSPLVVFSLIGLFLLSKVKT